MLGHHRAFAEISLADVGQRMGHTDSAWGHQKPRSASIRSPAVGPGPRAIPHWAAAAKAGAKRAAEIQFNNTCEIASVPYLPVMDLVAEHLRNLAPVKLDGMFIGWTMGGHPSPNFQLAQRLGAGAGA